MTSPDPPASAADRFFDGALERIRKFIVAIAVLGLIVCLIRFRWPVAVGFLLGAVISYVNHLWLARAVDALGERITTGQSREHGGLIVVRAGLRYGFVALGAYVIFNVSLAALYGFLGGVCLPIAAVACEVAVELITVLRRGF
jgi:hypothetical protein